MLGRTSPYGSTVTIPNLDWQIAELKRRGQDPATALSCVPSSGTPGAIKGIAGCQQYHTCPFSRRDFGGFKHTLPHNVPYAIDPKDHTGNATEAFIPCNLFARLLMPRMKAGAEAREQGLNGEIIQVLCEDGKLAETIIQSGNIRKPGALPTDPNPYIRSDVEVPVPPYKYPNEMQKQVVSRIKERMEQRRMADPANAPQVFPEDEAVLELAPRGKSGGTSGKQG